MASGMHMAERSVDSLIFVPRPRLESFSIIDDFTWYRELLINSN